MTQPNAVTITLPLQTSTPGNTRQHWRKDWQAGRQQRRATLFAVNGARSKPSFPVRVTLTRLSPRKMDRHNLPGAMKHIIDGIADAYGIDDGDPRWDFQFAQEPAPTIGVRLHIESIAIIGAQ